MSFNVVVTAKARSELYNNAVWWAENRSVEQAQRWLEAMEQTIELLRETAATHVLALENDDLAIELRQVNYGIGGHPTHRVVFELREDKVIVHGVRHLAQDAFTPDDMG